MPVTTSTKEIPQRDDEPPFDLFMRPGRDVTAEQIIYWIANTLDEVPDRTRHTWRVWFGQLAYDKVKERYGPWIETVGWFEWIKVRAPDLESWELRLKIGGVISDIEEMNTRGVVDRITVTLEIDDGTVPGMP